MEEKANKQGERVIPVAVIQQSGGEKGITLLDIWRILTERKQLIFGVTLVFLIGSLAYAFFTTPVYMATAYLLPPTVKDVEGLNVLEGNNFTPKLVYSMLIRNLNSRKLRKTYFDTHRLIKTLAPGAKTEKTIREVFEKSFNSVLKVSHDKGNKERVIVTFEAVDPEFAAETINGFIKMANRVTAIELANDLISMIESKKESLKKEIAAKRKVAKQRRLDRIAQLEEAILIAKRLKIEDNLLLKSVGKKEGLISVSEWNFPLYLLGAKVLEAEIDLLRQRKSDDPFILGLRYLQEKLYKLEDLKIDPSRISAMRVDQLANIPLHPIRPQRKLIVALGLTFGLVFAIFLALFLECIKREHQMRS